MKLKKYLPLIVSAAIASILIIAGVVLLIRFQKRYHVIRGNLKSAESEARDLLNRDPFPSEKNLDVQRENLVQLEEQFEAIQTWMKGNQIQFEEWSTPTEFQIQRQSNLQELREMARELGIGLPAEPHFGFRRYEQGEMPASANVPRLSRQLQMVRTVCEMLFSERIESLESVGRTVFEVERGGSPVDVGLASDIGRRGSSRGSEPRSDADKKDDKLKEKRDEFGMYAWENITVTFNARERSLWNILRTLTNTNLLVSVEDMDCESLNESMMNIRQTGSDRALNRRGRGFDAELQETEPNLRRGPADSVARPKAEQAEPLPRDERVIAGDGLVRVNMELRMYRLLDENIQEEIAK